MKVAIVSHSAVVPLYREKFQYLVKLGCEVHLILPPHWPEGGRMVAAPTPGVEHGVMIHVLTGRFLGKVGGFYLPRLSALLGKLAPELLHIEEEPFSLVAWQASRFAKKRKIPLVFFTWENILREYKWPLAWIDRQVLKRSRAAIAGNQEAEHVLAKRGFRGGCVVIPQYGVNPEIFRPYSVMHVVRPVYTIGFFGRLCEEKGLETLLLAVAKLPFPWQLLIKGNGPYAETLKTKIAGMGLEKKISLEPAVDNSKMPRMLQQLDVLVLPSQTTPDWKEQFGRILIEAMACAIPVIGSDSGEIPQVIGNAGMVFPEKDARALSGLLTGLHQDPDQADRLGRLGRERVLSLFTTERIAEQTWAWYRNVLGEK